jgi:hypothetical protein
VGARKALASTEQQAVLEFGLGGFEMASQSNQGDKDRSSFSLDPSRDKEEIEQRIAHSIEDQVRGLDDAEVQKAVKDKYEDLLEQAKVKQHIPTLTEGVVRADFRQKNGQSD